MIEFLLVLDKNMQCDLEQCEIVKVFSQFSDRSKGFIAYGISVFVCTDVSMLQ